MGDYMLFVNNRPIQFPKGPLFDDLEKAKTSARIYAEQLAKEKPTENHYVTVCKIIPTHVIRAKNEIQILEETIDVQWERQEQYDEFERLLDKWLESFDEDARNEVYANLNEVYANLNEPIVKDEEE